MIVHRPRSKLDNIHLTGAKSGLKRVESMNILGVTLTEKFDFDKHIDNIYVGGLGSHFMLSVFLLPTGYRVHHSTTLSVRHKT